MTDPALLRLLAWFSPAFPIGAFSYSHGLETAVEMGLVRGKDDLALWLDDILREGSGRNDAIFLGLAWHAATEGEPECLPRLIEEATALQTAAERRLETLQQGRAFVIAVQRAWPCEALALLPSQAPLPYPIAVGVAAAGHGLPLRPTLLAYLHAFAANLVSAGLRLIPLGQSDGLEILADLEPATEDVAASTLDADLEDVGNALLVLDWCAMRHETLYTRLFRS